MTPYYSDSSVTIYLGDALDVLRELPPSSVDAVVTSPPYAEQRKALYGGIAEWYYPDWTTMWMDAARSALQPDSSVLINIREHVRDGGISDYVHKTRLLVRDDGWNEVDELIWVKPDGPPVGRVDRPRRSWERVLWFSNSRTPRCYPRWDGRRSNRIGFIASEASRAWLANNQSDELEAGISRCPDFVVVSVGSGANGIAHPAVYPSDVALWMMSLVTETQGTVLDPFMGSGTTLVAAKYSGRKAVGVETEERYCELAAKRFAQEVLELT